MKKRLRTILLILILITFNAVIFLLGYVAHDMLKTKEEEVIWENAYVQIYPTDHLISKAAVWLSSIQDYELDYQNLERDFGNLSVELTKMYDEQGDFSWSVNEESYLLCEKKAYEKLGEIFVEVLMQDKKFQEKSREEVESSLTELLEMSITDYLKNCEIDLMPTKEDLISQAQGYDISKKDK